MSYVTSLKLSGFLLIKFLIIALIFFGIISQDAFAAEKTMKMEIKFLGPSADGNDFSVSVCNGGFTFCQEDFVMAYKNAGALVPPTEYNGTGGWISGSSCANCTDDQDDKYGRAVNSDGSNYNVIGSVCSDFHQTACCREFLE